jgi:hypothetical protein
LVRIVAEHPDHPDRPELAIADLNRAAELLMRAPLGAPIRPSGAIRVDSANLGRKTASRQATMGRGKC